MRIDYVSDLHVDHYISEKENQEIFINKFERIDYILFKNKTSYGDILIIAGDLSESLNQIKWVLLFYKERYKKVLYTHGNHCMYTDGTKTYKDKFLELKELEGIDYLVGEVVEYEGFKIGGIPMFYDFSYGYTFGKNQLDMYNLWGRTIRDAYRIDDQETYVPVVINGKEMIQRFDPISYMEEQYKLLENVKNSDLIFSHVMPFVPKQYPERYKKDPITGFFMFEGIEFIKENKIKTWIAGHTHIKIDFKQYGCRLLTNPYGYPGEIFGEKGICSLNF